MSRTFALIRRQRSGKKRRRARTSRLRVLGFALLGLAGLALLGLAAYGAREGARALVDAAYLQVREIEVEGAERVPQDELARALEPWRHTPILRVPLDEARAALESVSGVESAAVARRLPGLLEASVRERHPVARALFGQRVMLIDARGALFPPRRAMAGDEELPELVGLATPLSAPRLLAEDMVALDALDALIAASGSAPPPATRLDLSREDRLVLRAGDDAPVLWLDREDPAENLDHLIAWRETIAELSDERAVDLRFPHRLTLVPEGDDTARR